MNRRLAGALCASILLGFLAQNLGAQEAAHVKPPIAPVRPVTDEYFGIKVVDNYRYFEDLKNSEVQQWMKAQADYTHAVLSALPGRDALLARLRQLVLSATAARSTAAAIPRADSTVVILLGTGNPIPIPGQAGPATAIVVGSRVFLFDAGVDVMRRMSAAKLPIGGPTALFITHLHSDHTLGYPDVIFTTWMMGRKTPLEVYGPHGLQAMTDHIIAAWKEDIDVRTNGLAQLKPNGYAVHGHEIAPGVVYDIAGVKITAIPVLHGSWKEAYGYRVDTPDRSIVLSGDTRPSPALEQAARDVDVLIHEVYPEAADLIGAPTPVAGPIAYRRAFHTSDVELGRLAVAAKPKMLVLYHHGVPPDGGEKIVATIRAEGYRGHILFGKDLDRF